MKNAAEADATRVSPGFFAMDRGAFRCAAVGGLNVAVAHLVMARFVAWEPFPRQCAPDHSDEPSAPPGAVVRASAKSSPDAHSGTRRRPR